jgi:AcrR family transcriptional regulator
MNIHSVLTMPRLTVHARRALFQERRAQILQAAAAVFAEKGFDAATIRDVARAAGVAEGSIYLYFKNKQDLLVHLPRQFIQPPVESLRAASMSATAAPTPEELLSAIVRNIAQVVLQNRELIRVFFTSLPTMDEATRAEYLQEGPGYALEFLQEYIRAQQAAGIFRADLDPAITARSLPGMMLFFLLVQEILQPRDMPRFEYDAVIPNVIQVFLHGVMNEAKTKSPAKTIAKAKPKARPAPRARKGTKQSIAIE